MKIFADKTGRFRKRIYYEQSELDFECEDVISNFLLSRYGKVNYPIHTDDLTVLIEQRVSDFDMYADLSNEGPGIEGVTCFIENSKPSVKISKTLSENNRENRLRTTITHELGHVHFHLPLISIEFDSPKLPFLDEPINKSTTIVTNKCNRDSILTATQVDWVEWQAGYASGAFLMPITPLRQLIQNYFLSNNLPSKIWANSIEGKDIIHCTQELFQVSEDASRIRLLKLGYLTEELPPPTIF